MTNSDPGAARLSYADRDETALVALMTVIAPRLAAGAVVYLKGDLGAGKTTCARALIQALGYPHRVKSPTYALLEEYRLAAVNVFHLDLYRLSDPRDVVDLGLEECLEQHPALLLIEWPERGHPYLPQADLVFALKLAPIGRELEISAASRRGQQLLQTLPEFAGACAQADAPPSPA
ncbi:MAG: tRNA (adenosine(37)-N6)-threonylcarbamoyltransferase complex ATPase subunit type 1 TsaE [Wenzhouxiangellaceae bacterium]